MVGKRPADSAASDAKSSLFDAIAAAAASLPLSDLMRLGCASPALALAARAAVQALPVRLSVVLPIYNAHGVGLSVAVRDVLRQTHNCPPFELLAVDDGSSDGGRLWLAELAAALGPRGAVQWSDHGLNPHPSLTAGPALASAAEGFEVADTACVDDEHSLGGRAGSARMPYASKRGGSGSAHATATETPLCAGGGPAVLSPEAVAGAASVSLVRLTVLSTLAGARGQGAAMDVALEHARGEVNSPALLSLAPVRPGFT
jgi:glycosyltransferase involved in cell wall biosynthesis